MPQWHTQHCGKHGSLLGGACAQSEQGRQGLSGSLAQCCLGSRCWRLRVCRAEEHQGCVQVCTPSYKDPLSKQWPSPLSLTLNPAPGSLRAHTGGLKGRNYRIEGTPEDVQRPQGLQSWSPAQPKPLQRPPLSCGTFWLASQGGATAHDGAPPDTKASTAGLRGPRGARVDAAGCLFNLRLPREDFTQQGKRHEDTRGPVPLPEAFVRGARLHPRVGEAQDELARGQEWHGCGNQIHVSRASTEASPGHSGTCRQDTSSQPQGKTPVSSNQLPRGKGREPSATKGNGVLGGPTEPCCVLGTGKRTQRADGPVIRHQPLTGGQTRASCSPSPIFLPPFTTMNRVLQVHGLLFLF